MGSEMCVRGSIDTILAWDADPVGKWMLQAEALAGQAPNEAKSLAIKALLGARAWEGISILPVAADSEVLDGLRQLAEMDAAQPAPYTHLTLPTNSEV